MTRQTMDAFTLGYIECALWSENLNDVSVSDLSAETLGRLVADAKDFQKTNRALLDRANEQGRDDAHLGHDFWLSRNGHGTGFWDRGLGAIGTELHKNAKPYGECHLELGEDEFTVYVF